MGLSSSRVSECAQATLLILPLLGPSLPALALCCAIAWHRLLRLLGWLPALEACTGGSRSRYLHLTRPLSWPWPILRPMWLGILLPDWSSSRRCLGRVGQPLLWTPACLIPGWRLEPASARLDLVQLLKLASISTRACLSEAGLMRPSSSSVPACLHEGGPLGPRTSTPASWCEAGLLWLAPRPPACLAEARLARAAVHSAPACLCRTRLLWCVFVPAGALDVPPGSRQPRHWHSSCQRAVLGSRPRPWRNCMGPARLIKACPAGLLGFCRGGCPLAVLLLASI